MADQESWAARAWDQRYRNGNLYKGHEAIPFVKNDVAPAIRSLSASFDFESFSCLEIGIGNGRNIRPLMSAGLSRLVGLDISGVALEQLQKKPIADSHTQLELRQGDLSVLSLEEKFAAVLAIHVFQHGTRDEGLANIDQAKQHVAGGGLLALCVEAVVNKPKFEDGLAFEVFDDGSYTIYPNDGGGPIHAFSRPELDIALSGFNVVQSLRYVTSIFPKPVGIAARWEGIWRLE